MAVNKNALIRFHALDRCFSNFGRKFFIEDLLDYCNETLYEINPAAAGIKKRQLFEDIKFMESAEGWSVPLRRIKEGKRVYYRYGSSGYSINKQPIHEQEAEKLKSALTVLSRFKGIPQFEWVNEMILKLQENFKLQSNQQTIVNFDSNEYLTNLEYLGDLFNAILNRQTLCISYQSFKKAEPDTFNLYPYHLKQYNNRWFLFGRKENLTEISNLALDRILSFEPCSIAYSDTTTNFEEYFEDIIGVSKPQKEELKKIRLWIAYDLWPYIRTKPLHGSQRKIEENQQGVIIELELIINYELTALLFSYGERICILSPEELKNTFVNRLKTMLTHYKNLPVAEK